MLEAMDALEVAFSNPMSKKTDCNHIFLNLLPTVLMDPTKIEESIKNIVLRYGIRLWKLRVLQAEIRMTIRRYGDGVGETSFELIRGKVLIATKMLSFHENYNNLNKKTHLRQQKNNIENGKTNRRTNNERTDI